jgi:hypothetical protein
MADKPKPTIDERLEAIVMTLEMLTQDVRALSTSVQGLNTAVQQDAENIRALARIAEIHERRISHLEDNL